MSISGLFNTAQSGLLASQTALSVTSNNIANVNTPSYSKQSVILQIAQPTVTGSGTIGSGVTVSGITRSYDRFIQAQLMGQDQSTNRSAAQDQAWGQIEQVFNDVQGTGLSAAMADYINAWNDVATDPTGMTQRSVLLQKASALTTSAQHIESSIVQTLDNTNASITGAAKQANTIASAIAQINGQIMQQEAGSGAQTAIDLRDQRDQKLNELSKLVGFSSYEDPNGSLTVMVGMRTLVSGTGTNQFSTARNADGNPDLYLDGMNITGAVQSGQLGGLIEARKDIQTNVLTSFRKLIASLTQQMNIQHQAGYGLDGSTAMDFFNPLQVSTINNSASANITATITDPALLTLDEYAITFDSGGNYSVFNKQSGALVSAPAPYVSGNTISLPGVDVVISGAVTPADSFVVSTLTTAVSNFGVALSDPRQVAASSSPLQLPGNNANALLMVQLTDTVQANLGNNTFASYYGSIVSTVGVKKQTAANSLSFDQNLLSALQAKRDSISGVSLDEEAANLIRYQRSYQAAARMITVTDELLQTVLAMGSGL
ncbi:MAG: flagellar hook-associated protein FlgK [Nitrospirae bacterium]|nr:flagellar hook-associated protein FlgK [Nitrospirota bacterium]NTW65650.1 flagellar hook-associated protein FlgK [Nitrospirota bacterium]